MKKLAVVLTTPPLSSLTNTAINYIKCALEEGITIVGVFFYQDGVLNASKSISIPSDEYQTMNAWRDLHLTYNLPLHICITAAEKRGLSDDEDIGNNISELFTISGLGELVELSAQADRVVQM